MYELIGYFILALSILLTLSVPVMALVDLYEEIQAGATGDGKTATTTSRSCLSMAREFVSAFRGYGVAAVSSSGRAGLLASGALATRPDGLPRSSAP
jgi:hypothetical protein